MLCDFRGLRVFVIQVKPVIKDESKDEIKIFTFDSKIFIENFLKIPKRAILKLNNGQREGGGQRFFLHIVTFILRRRGYFIK